MVLGGNVYTAGLQIFDRVVAAAVSVFHFVRIRTGCQCHQLMSEADCKDRDIGIVQFADLFNNGSTFFRISRSVGKHDAVRIGCYDLFCCGQCRIYGHFAAASVQIAGDVSLCTEVKKCYFRSVSFQDVFLCAGHFFYHFACIICCDLRKNLT